MEKQIEIYECASTNIFCTNKIRGFVFDTVQETCDWLQNLNIAKSAPSFNEISFGQNSYFPKSALKKFNTSIKVNQNADVIIEPWDHTQKLYVKLEHLLKENNAYKSRGYEIRLCINKQIPLDQQMKKELADYQEIILSNNYDIEKVIVCCETRDEQVFENIKDKYVVSDFVFWTYLSKNYGASLDKEKCESLKQMLDSEDQGIQKLVESMVFFYNWEGFEDELPLIMARCGYTSGHRPIKKSNSVFCNFFYHNCLCPPQKSDVAKPFNHFANCYLIKYQSFSDYSVMGKIRLNKLAKQTVDELNEIHDNRFYLNDYEENDITSDDLSLSDRIIYNGVKTTFKFLIQDGCFTDWCFKVGDKKIRL